MSIIDRSGVVAGVRSSMELPVLPIDLMLARGRCDVVGWTSASSDVLVAAVVFVVWECWADGGRVTAGSLAAAAESKNVPAENESQMLAADLSTVAAAPDGVVACGFAADGDAKDDRTGLL